MDQLLLGLRPPTGLAYETNTTEQDQDPFADLADAANPVAARPDGPTVGVLWALDEKGTPWVRFAGSPGGVPVPARSVIALDSGAVGREVVLLFEQNDAAKPLVMGVVQTQRTEPIRTEIDGEKLVFTAERQIVFRCGEASITLTRSGKVLIKGAYVLTRSAGVNCIKGAAVEIN